MAIPTLAIFANPQKIGALIDKLLGPNLNLLFCSDMESAQHAVLALTCIESLNAETNYSIPWLAWDQTGDLRVISRAYQAGARAVFPKETPVDVIVDTTCRTIGELLQHSVAPRQRRRRAYRRGELVLLEADAVLYIEEGIFATTMIHQDGIEVLLGLSGKGQIVVAHPDDNCHIQIVAHTDARVHIEPWDEAVNHPDFSMKLRARLQQMEGWAAMQARPSLQQRVLGLLGLLAGQFGIAHEQGTLIDARITHAQLASAVGATRTSITRVLGELRDAGKITILSAQGEGRFCLCDKNMMEDHR